MSINSYAEILNINCCITLISTLLFCESDKRTEKGNELSECGGGEDMDQDQGLDMSVEWKLKKEEASGEEEQNGTSHGSPHESDNEASNCESTARSADDEAAGEWRADVRLVFMRLR
jgi:hypothetical protein